MEDVRWPAEQLEEHHLEISNRIRNLFWTVSGDYDTEFEPDTEKYVYSKQTVLYEAVKQGAFARYFDQKKLGMYLMKKLHFSAGEDMLLPLAGLCMDAAVNRFTIRERLGTKEIREWAFRELEKAEEEQVSDKAGTGLIHRIRLLYIRHVLENTDDKGMDPQAEIALYKILSLKNAENTEDVINVIDEIYNHVLDPSFGIVSFPKFAYATPHLPSLSNLLYFSKHSFVKSLCSKFGILLFIVTYISPLYSGISPKL